MWHAKMCSCWWRWSLIKRFRKCMNPYTNPNLHTKFHISSSNRSWDIKGLYFCIITHSLLLANTPLLSRLQVINSATVAEAVRSAADSESVDSTYLTYGLYARPVINWFNDLKFCRQAGWNRGFGRCGKRGA